MTLKDNDMLSMANQQHEITRWTRVEPPTHYLFQIKSYSILSKIGMNKCESGDFEADGYNWNLKLYPNGDEGVKDHISLYLAISNTKNLADDWEVKVIFRFFIFDQIRHKYLTIQDGRIRWYYKMKTEHGLTHLLSHKSFNEASNGYLVNDRCTFGVEVSVIKVTNRGESLEIIDDPQLGYFSWLMSPFSTFTGKYYTSSPFTVKGRKWRLEICPNGNSYGVDTHVSLFITLDESENIPVGKKIYAKFSLGLYNFTTSKYFEQSGEYWIDNKVSCVGFIEFVALSDLKVVPYVKNDELYFQGKILAMSTIDDD